MHLYTNYLNHLHLKNDSFETVKKATNDSEKIEVLIAWAQEVDETLRELKIILKGSL